MGDASRFDAAADRRSPAPAAPGDGSRSGAPADLASPPPAAIGDGARTLPPPSRLSLWFAFLGAPIAWAVNLILGYTIQATVCETTGPGTTILGLPAAHALPALFSVLAAAVALAGVLVAWSDWRVTGTGEENPEASVPADVGRSWFMAYGGFVSSMLFLLAILLTGVVELSAAPCSVF